MQKRSRSSRRTLTKRVTSINFYVDQATQIQAIMEATGSTKEAPLVRQLVDEALAARRRKLVPVESDGHAPPLQDIPETLQTIQTLLLRTIGQGQRTLRIERISLELLQETLVEARAGRISFWESLAMPALRERGRGAQQIADLFDAKTDEAKDFSYGLAEEIRDQLDAAETDSGSAAANEEDRQARLTYEDSGTREDRESDGA
jgi:hypothetical protein